MYMKSYDVSVVWLKFANELGSNGSIFYHLGHFLQPSCNIHIKVNSKCTIIIIIIQCVVLRKSVNVKSMCTLVSTRVDVGEILNRQG